MTRDAQSQPRPESFGTIRIIQKKGLYVRSTWKEWYQMTLSPLTTRTEGIIPIDGSKWNKKYKRTIWSLYSPDSAFFFPLFRLLRVFRSLTVAIYVLDYWTDDRLEATDEEMVPWPWTPPLNHWILFADDEDLSNTKSRSPSFLLLETAGVGQWGIFYYLTAYNAIML